MKAMMKFVGVVVIFAGSYEIYEDSRRNSSLVTGRCHPILSSTWQIVLAGCQKDTKTFCIQKIRKPFWIQRYENLLDPKDMNTSYAPLTTMTEP
jgi:hypothetical protein